MEFSRDRPSPVDAVIATPPKEDILNRLGELRTRPTVRSRFFPLVAELAERQFSGRQLTQLLIESADRYAQTTKWPDENLRILVSELPEYLRRLMPEGEAVDETINLLDEFINSPDGQELLRRRSLSTDDSGEPEVENPLRGLPRGVKNKLSKLPLEVQRHQAEQWRAKQLGKQGVKGSRRSGGKGSKPRYSSLDAARKAAEIQRQREQRGEA